MTDRELLDYLQVHCRTGHAHRDHLRRLFRMAGEATSFLDESEWWATTPDAIDPLVSRAREFLTMRREDAEEAYRRAWDRWRMSIALERSRLEREMARLQPLIADREEDPYWVEFVNTLPGFRILGSKVARNPT